MGCGLKKSPDAALASLMAACTTIIRQMARFRKFCNTLLADRTDSCFTVLARSNYQKKNSTRHCCSKMPARHAPRKKTHRRTKTQALTLSARCGEQSAENKLLQICVELPGQGGLFCVLAPHLNPKRKAQL